MSSAVFLGTGTSQGIPLIACDCAVCKSTDVRDKRLRSALLVKDRDNTFVIDTGPDFRQQMLREKVTNLTAVLFTHEHKDHIAGLDDVRAFNFRTNREVDVYATNRVQQAIKREYAYIFDEFQYPGIPRISLHTLHNVPFEISGTSFVPIEVMHYKLPVLGFRIGNFTYITDAKTISDAEKEKIKGTEILVLNALRKAEHISHFTLDEALELANEIKPRITYLTHISHQLGTHAETEKILPPNVQLAYDGLIVPFNAD